MFTRKDHMAKNCTHRQYWAQFVTPSILQLVRSAIGEETILTSTDQHLNDIPLKKWDALHQPSDHNAEEKFLLQMELVGIV